MPHTSRPILVIIGPSGAGKSTAIRQLVQEGAVTVNPSWTTRPPRPDELAGNIEHRFASEETFSEQEDAGLFLETVQLFGLPYRYGLPPVQSSAPGQVPVVMLRASLLDLLHKHYPNAIVYQISDNPARIAKRLKEREAQGEPIGTRLSGYEEEVRLGLERAHRNFVNDGDIAKLAEALRAAIREDFLQS